jgi:Schlafen, AlbA_2/AAA ATPase domain
MTDKHQISISELRRIIFRKIIEDNCTVEIIKYLSNGDRLVEQEDALWDYKSYANIDPVKKTSALGQFNAHCCELVKDIVAFYNTYGGYLIFGVDDRTKTLFGFDEEVDLNAVMSRIEADTGRKICISFCRLVMNEKTIGLMHIPRRPDAEQPLQFRKDAKIANSGKKAYKSNDIYFRDGGRSLPATGSQSLSFLFSSGKRNFFGPKEVPITSITSNNLRANDRSFVKFVGRELYLEQLWRWLIGWLHPVRVVSGVGGVGKTTLVREFAEEVLSRSPLGFENLIWLTAKRTYFRPFDDKIADAEIDENPHFYSPLSLYRSLLGELGYLDIEIDEDAPKEEVLEKLIDALKITPSFIVVDDLDSLEIGQQIDIFQDLNAVIRSTTPAGKAPSRAIITARLTLGASAGQLLKIEGFNESELFEFVCTICEQYGRPFSHGRDSKLFKRFHKITEGSPLFASSIVRMICRGEPVEACLNQWKGASGEEVRKFAFERELSTLTDSQVRTLYALSRLSRCSFLQLKDVLESNKGLLLDDLSVLRDFHLLSSSGESLHTGDVFSVPDNIVLLHDIIRERLIDPRRIEQKCKNLRKESKSQSKDVGEIIARVVTLWNQDQPNQAIEEAEHALKNRGETHPDLECILGRAYLRSIPANPTKADSKFKNAHNLHCERPELFDFWIEAKKMRGDWTGIVEIGEVALKKSGDIKHLVDIGEAYLSLAEDASNSGQIKSSINYYTQVGRRVNDSFTKKIVYPYFTELNDIRRTAYLEAVRLAVDEYRSPNEAIEIWEICWEAFRSFVRVDDVIHNGVSSLLTWAFFASVMRERKNENTRSKMRAKLHDLTMMHRILVDKEWDDSDMVDHVALGKEKMEKLVMEYESLFEVE